MSTLGVLLTLVAISVVSAAPSISSASKTYQEYPSIVPQKRAALVLDRLLIALQRALHEDPSSRDRLQDRDGPRTAPLRLPAYDQYDLMAVAPGERQWGVKPLDPLPRPATPLDGLQEDPTVGLYRLEHIIDRHPRNKSALQRRGQGGPRGRVLRCYFNAVTCF